MECNTATFPGVYTLNRKKIKRRYFDMRVGAATISPILSMSNFLMLSYLTINELIPIWIFAPMFVISVALALVLVGNRFRKIQTSTDINMQYEKSSDWAKTQVVMMNALFSLLVYAQIQPSPEFVRQLDHVKKISEERV